MNGWRALGFDSYPEYLLSDLWNKKIEHLKNRPCSKCGSIKKIQIHHKTYENVGNEGNNDLRILCKKCHEKLHKIMKENPNLSEQEAYWKI